VFVSRSEGSSEKVAWASFLCLTASGDAWGLAKIVQAQAEKFAPGSGNKRDAYSTSNIVVRKPVALIRSSSNRETELGPQNLHAGRVCYIEPGTRNESSAHVYRRLMVYREINRIGDET
jgi:hypothetical protein